MYNNTLFYKPLNNLNIPNLQDEKIYSASNFALGLHYKVKIFRSLRNI